jgi:hypothetical protein
MNESKRNRIAARAHEIWEAEGRPPDKAEEHWRRAEQEVAREERAEQMGGRSEPPAPDVDSRPVPPIDAAPPLEGAETSPATTGPESAEKKGKRKSSGRSRRPRTESQQG